MFSFLLVLLIWVFSVCLHEFGHAWVAERGGDYTVREKGYLSMNPVHYAHPVMSFVLPMLFMAMGGFGLPGGAVYIERDLLRSRGWGTAVSLAGPAMNLLLALILTALLRLVLIPRFPDQNLTLVIAFALQLQISAILFNLIPIPPLDGYRAIMPWLPDHLQEQLLPLNNYGIFVIFILFQAYEPLNGAFWTAVYFITDLLGVDPSLGYAGYQAFRFWTH